MVKTVLITSQRMGSTLFVKTFDQYKNVHFAGEVFHIGNGIHHPENQFPFNKYLNSNRFNYLLNYPNLAQNYSSFLTKFYKNHERSQVVGFKLMLSQTKFLPKIIDYLLSNGVQPIFLTRRDTLGCALSSITAQHTGIYHEFQNSTSEKIASKLELKLLNKRINKVVEANNKIENLSSMFSNSLMLDYSDFNSFPELNTKFSNFFNIPMEPVFTGTKKISSLDKYRTIYSNFDEVMDRLNKGG